MKIIDPYRFASGAVSPHSKDKSFWFNEASTDNERLNIGNVLNEDGSGAFSVEAWVKMNGASATGHCIVGKYGGGIGWYLQVNASEQVEWILRRSGSRASVKTSGTIDTSGNWVHVVATYDGTRLVSGMHVYFDANDETLTTVEDTLGASSIDTTASMYIGTLGTAAFDFQGKMYYVTKYNKELSSAEVSELYNSGTPIDPEYDFSASGNIESIWRMGNVSGDDATPTTGTIQDTVGGNDGVPTSNDGDEIVTDAP